MESTTTTNTGSAAAAAADPPTDRASLVHRQIAEMALSDGGPASNTAPPLPAPRFLTAAEAALYRFGVNGHAIGR